MGGMGHGFTHMYDVNQELCFVLPLLHTPTLTCRAMVWPRGGRTWLNFTNKMAEVTHYYLNRLALLTFTEVGPQFANQDSRLGPVMHRKS